MTGKRPARFGVRPTSETGQIGTGCRWLANRCQPEQSQSYCERLAKRRRALLESNSPRNSQPETHPDDGWGRQLKSPPSCRSGSATSDDRFPDASENSCPGPPIKALLLELHRRTVAQGGV